MRGRSRRREERCRCENNSLRAGEREVSRERSGEGRKGKRTESSFDRARCYSSFVVPDPQNSVVCDPVSVPDSEQECCGEEDDLVEDPVESGHGVGGWRGF